MALHVAWVSLKNGTPLTKTFMANVLGGCSAVFVPCSSRPHPAPRRVKRAAAPIIVLRRRVFMFMSLGLSPLKYGEKTIPGRRSRWASQNGEEQENPNCEVLPIDRYAKHDN